MADECKVYRRRWLMLVIFFFATLLNSAHWLEYSIISNIIMKYYGISAIFVNWSALIFSAVYLVFIFPATWLMEKKKGLRLVLLTSILVTCLGSWLKLFSLNRTMFPVAFFCQFVVGCGQIFVLSAPPRLAGLWFPSHQESTVCSIGVIGNLLGSAVGFHLPPILVINSDNFDEIWEDLLILHLILAIPVTILLIVAILCFEDAPLLPPSIANLSARLEHKRSFASNLKDLSFNRNYILLLFIFSLNLSVFYAYSILLNQLILAHFPDGEKDAGRIGTLLLLGGMLGTFSLGIVLDRTHYFKGLTVIIFTASALGMIAFQLSLYYEQMVTVYVSSAVLGFFMTGFLTVAYEFAAELTFPLVESTSAGMLMFFGEAFGMLVTTAAGLIFDGYSDLQTNLFFVCVLSIGLSISVFIKGIHLRRLSVNNISLSFFRSHSSCSKQTLM